MISIVEQHVFLVDDEPKVLQAVSKALGNLGVEISSFSDAVDCIKQLKSQRCDMVITDLEMPQMDGIELLANIKRYTPWVPVLVMTGYGDIPTAVRAIQAGAEDFIEKPVIKKDFWLRTKSLLQKSSSINAHASRFLTWRQLVILQQVIDEKDNQEIADLLGLPVKTVEEHRAQIMKRLRVNNLIELIKWAITKKLINSTS